MKFQTTAEIRSATDRPIQVDAFRYATAFLGVLLIDQALAFFVSDLPDPMVPCVLAANLVTIPTTQPQFRTLKRFLGLTLWGLTLAALIVSVGWPGVNRAIAAIGTVLHASLVVGVCESLQYLWLCLLTPGRD